MTEYFSEADFSRDSIEAGIASGELRPWRVDGEGRTWYRRTPPILGVPADGDFAEATEVDIEAEDQQGGIDAAEDATDEIDAVTAALSLRLITASWPLLTSEQRESILEIARGAVDAE